MGMKTGEKHVLPASYVKVGDWLHTDTTEPAQVENVMTVSREGAYAPFTMSGTIVVNGVVSSSYVSLQGTDTLMIGRMKTHLSMHSVAHLSTSPFRLLALLGVPIPEFYNDEGLSIWIALPHTIAKNLLTKNTVFIGVVFPFAAIILVPCYVVELLVSSRLSILSLVFAGYVMFHGCYGSSNQTKRKVA